MAPPAKTPTILRQPQVACPSTNPENIVVCAQRGRAYRIDPNISEAQQQVDANSQAATSAMPAAQANCSQSPAGCGKGLESLDLANVAFVAGTMAVRAAKGEDWRRALRTGGPDEYQLYRQAKQRREALEAERAAAAMRKKAEEAERRASAAGQSAE